jgi:putative DNA primase/helicase
MKATLDALLYVLRDEGAAALEKKTNMARFCELDDAEAEVVCDALRSKGVRDQAISTLLQQRATPKSSRKTTYNATDEALLTELAALSPVAYGRRRTSAAKVLEVNVTTLDCEVKERRAERRDRGVSLPHWNVEPWSQVVDGAILLAEIEQVFARYVVLPKHAAVALALWVMHAWAFNAWDISPFMVLASPEKRCGKTTVLILLYYLTPHSELASNISASAIFRYIEDQQPTLLVDEADSFVKNNDEMRGILNSGHTKVGANVLRNVEVNGAHVATRFSTWAPKAIATIGSLAATLEDRSIIVTMQRKLKEERVERLRRRDNEEFAELRRRALRWRDDNLAMLVAAEPIIPDMLNDRAADNWRPLFAIADLVGRAWPEQARTAAAAFSGDDAGGTGSSGTRLIADIAAIFAGAPNISSMTTVAIVAELVKDPTKPWADWRHGRAITARAVADLLHPYKIFSQEVYHPNRGRGYLRHAFGDAIARYSEGSKVGSSGSADGTWTSAPFQRSGLEPHPDLCERREIAAAVGDPDVPTFEPSGSGAYREKGEIEGGGDNGEGANGADESQHVDAFPTIADDDGRGNVVEQPRWRRRL